MSNLRANFFKSEDGIDMVELSIIGDPNSVIHKVESRAEEFEKKFLGEIPINPEVGKCGDDGKPIVEANPEHEMSKIYLDFANTIKSTYLKDQKLPSTHSTLFLIIQNFQ